jgi:Cu/Ag efflux protein CusF
MAFMVKDKALMDKLGKDKKVDFEFRQDGKDYVISAVK